MIDFSEFENHLKTIPAADWEELFKLNEQLKQESSFGKMKAGEKIEENVSTFPYWEKSELARQFVKFLYDKNMLPSFDWPEWQEGKELLRQKDPNFANLDTITLCKLLTAIIRTDRFSDGTLIGMMKEGVIQRIVDGIQGNYEKNKPNQR